ncbi:MAG: M14 family metallopeptidase [bacterium]
MLKIIDYIPEGFLSVGLEELPRILPNPTLIHLPGRRSRPLFVSVLLHGNEETGLLALQALLGKYARAGLPRALSVFIGNMQAAPCRRRMLDNQPDYNRVWKAGNSPEHALAGRVLEIMRKKNPFACVDVHNNTGINPHHSAVNFLDNRILRLATLFSRRVIYFTSPEGSLASAFGNFCPAVTIECGQPGHEYGTRHTAEYLDGCLHMAELPDKKPDDIDIYHIVAKIKVKEGVSFGFGLFIMELPHHDENSRLSPKTGEAPLRHFHGKKVDLCFRNDIDHLNFQEVSAGTLLGKMGDGLSCPLEIFDQVGNQVENKYLSFKNKEIRLLSDIIPVMFTREPEAVRQDCLGYFMKRYRP